MQYVKSSRVTLRYTPLIMIYPPFYITHILIHLPKPIFTPRKPLFHSSLISMIGLRSITRILEITIFKPDTAHVHGLRMTLFCKPFNDPDTIVSQAFFEWRSRRARGYSCVGCGDFLVAVEVF